ncbi:MAG: hypothetical protein ACJ754_07960 [Pyrinomonadaceae bacterium]
MSVKASFAGLALGVGLVAGFALNHFLPIRPVLAQQPGKILVQGHGRGVSTLKPPGEQFTLTAENDPRRSFKVVPAGKKFVLTDAVYVAQGSVREDLTVNVAAAQPASGTSSILFQVRISPGESHEVHLCSGYVIPSGHALAAWTNAGLAPEQYVSVSVTGYLADE